MTVTRQAAKASAAHECAELRAVEHVEHIGSNLEAIARKEAFVARSWERAARGLNNILAVYGRGEKPRYRAV